MHFDRPRPRWARTLSLAALGVLSASGASTVVFANHQDPAVLAPLRGLITAVGASTMQIQTSNGTVNVGLARGITHVVRSVMGSTGDVTPGKRVDLHLVKGTRTVDAIRIEQPKPAPVHRIAVHTKDGDRPLPRREVNDAATSPLSGQVVTLNGGTLTLRYGNGTTGTFTLTPNVHVNEALSGSLADLGVGETVQVVLQKSGDVARSVIITNA